MDTCAVTVKRLAPLKRLRKAQRMNFTYSLDVDIADALRCHAYRYRRPLSECVEVAIAEFLEKNEA